MLISNFLLVTRGNPPVSGPCTPVIRGLPSLARLDPWQGKALFGLFLISCGAASH